MELVGDLPENADAAMIEDLGGTFVAVRAGPSGELSDIGDRLLERRAHGLRILGLSDEGRRGYLYELRPTEVAIGDVSPERLLNVIRAAIPFDAHDTPTEGAVATPPRTRPNAGLTA